MRASSSARYLFVGYGIQAIVQAVSLVAISRLLEVDEFSAVAAISVANSLALVFVEAGIGPAMVRAETLTAEVCRAAWRAQMLLGIGFAALVGTLAEFALPSSAQAAVQVGGLAIVGSAVSSTSMNLLRRDDRFHLVALSTTLAAVVGSICVSIPLALAGYGALSLAWGNVASATFLAVATTAAAAVPLRGEADYTGLAQFRRFSTGVFASRFANFLSSRSDYVVIGVQLGSIPLGLYERAFRLTALPTSYIGQAMDQIAFSRLARTADPLERLRLVSKANALTMALAAVLPAVLLSDPDTVVSVLLGPGWEKVAQVIPLLGLAASIGLGSRVYDSLVRGIGDPMETAKRKLQFVAVLVVLVIAGSERFGIVGAAAGVLVAQILHYARMTLLGASVLSVRAPVLFRSSTSGLIVFAGVFALCEGAFHFIVVPGPLALVVLGVAACSGLVMSLLIGRACGLESPSQAAGELLALRRLKPSR